MTQSNEQERQQLLFDWRKAFDATDHKVSNWMTVTWGVPQRSTKGNFLSQIKKNYSPIVPEQPEMFMFSDDKSVVALNRTAGNRENQSMETQNWKQDKRLPRQAFLPSNYDDVAFQKENAFPRQKAVASTNLSQMIRRKTKDICGKDVLKKKTYLGLNRFFRRKLRFFPETF